MYTIATLADVVQIHPSDFRKQSNRAIEDWINAKYANKVFHKLGLCVGFHSLISASEGLIGHGNGIVNVNVDFRLVVFRPFKGEIVSGTINHATLAGIFISMDFFDDIVVPPSVMFSDSKFVQDGESWVWIWYSEVGELYYDRGEKCLLRIEDERWYDLSPQMKRPDDFDLERKDEFGMRMSPYKILASMGLQGLGPTLWWGGDGNDGVGAPAEDDGDADVEMES